MAVAIPIIVIIAVGIATVIVLANRQRAATGELSRQAAQDFAAGLPTPNPNARERWPTLPGGSAAHCSWATPRAGRSPWTPS